MAEVLSQRQYAIAKLEKEKEVRTQRQHVISKAKKEKEQTYSLEELFKTSNNGRQEFAGLSYDEEMRKWTETAVQSTPLENVLTSSDNSGSSSLTPQAQEQIAGGGAKTDSEFKAEQEYIEIEYNTLQGDGTVLPTKKTIRLKQGKTVTLYGLGKYLSGQYFISGIKRSIDESGGYSQSCTFIKTGFGDSLKSGNAEPQINDPNRPEEAELNDTTGIEVNDSIIFTDDGAVYANAHDGVKVPAWVRKKTNLTVSQISADGTRALIQPINSWTYTKYLKKS